MNLQLRILTTNLLVLGLGVLSSAVIGHSYKAQQFPQQIQQMEQHAQAASQRPKSLSDAPVLSVNTMQLFDEINDKGTLLALTFSFMGAGVLSLWTTYSILHPLRQADAAAKQYNSGDMNARIPPSNIPEIHQLGLTLNSIANRLQGVEERRQALIGDLAHELGTPLTVIRGYLEMLKYRKLRLTPIMCEELYEEAERMNRLLDDLKVLSTIETGSLSLKLQPLFPRPILQRVTSIFKARGWQNNCSLSLDCPDRLPMIFADSDRFRQILTNLISNALAYTPEGNVTVRARSVDHQLQIEVIDTGIGICPEELPYIFDRFWRSPDSRDIRQDGSGIGLSITKRLVEVMGGQIEVESQLGQGTTFRVCLPLASPHHWQIRSNSSLMER